MRLVPVLLACACAAPQAKSPASAERESAGASDTSKTRPAAIDPMLTPDVVLATIRGRYIGGLERCYRRHAKKEGATSGRVLVSFTVDPSGRARESEARGITDHVEDCITAQMTRWRFPAPKEEARFALGLQLFAN